MVKFSFTKSMGPETRTAYETGQRARRVLKRGMTVMIYQDPQTETQPEGKAELIRRTLAAAPSDELKQEFWFVRFLVTGDRVDRWIKTA